MLLLLGGAGQGVLVYAGPDPKRIAKVMSETRTAKA